MHSPNMQTCWFGQRLGPSSGTPLQSSSNLLHFSMPGTPGVQLAESHEVPVR